MSPASFTVRRLGDSWTVESSDGLGVLYPTKEAATEAAWAAASAATEAGHEVEVHIPGVAQDGSEQQGGDNGSE